MQQQLPALLRHHRHHSRYNRVFSPARGYEYARRRVFRPWPVQRRRPAGTAGSAGRYGLSAPCPLNEPDPTFQPHLKGGGLAAFKEVFAAESGEWFTSRLPVVVSEA